MKYLFLDNNLRVTKILTFPPPSGRYGQCLPVPAHLTVSAGMRYIPELNAFLDPDRNVITTRVTIADSKPENINVVFPGDVQWSILDTGNLDLKKTNSGLAVRPTVVGTYTVRLHISLADKEAFTAELNIDVQKEVPE